MIWLRKLLGHTSHQISPSETARAEEALEDAHQRLGESKEQHKEAARLARNLRRMREENHFAAMVDTILGGSIRE